MNIIKRLLYFIYTVIGAVFLLFSAIILMSLVFVGWRPEAWGPGGFFLGLSIWLLLKARSIKKGIDGKASVVAWARYVLNNPDDFAIIDTETTGLDEDAEVVEIAAIDPAGKVLFSARVRPRHLKSMPIKAKSVHNISMSHLKDEPTWDEQSSGFRDALGSRTVISYNAEFDKRLIEQTARINGGCSLGKEWQCAMLKYAEFVGKWNKSKKGHYWQPLNGDHSALGDCRAVLRLLHEMAN